VESNGNSSFVSVTANTVSSFVVPESWEMESSGIIEDQGIHVYCSTANLSVSFLSHSPYSSNGSFLIPSVGLGNDYVVAAYGSYYLNGAKYSYDYPSECTIAATQDNTTITITPSCNCRKDTSGNSGGDSNAAVLAFPAGQPFTVTLNRGQSMQLMPVLPSDPDNFDLTGTIIHANHPIGVIGGSMYAEIPNGYSNANFICDMLPPVRSWGETYYSTNLTQPPGETDKDIEEYLFISSQSGQIIYRSQCGSSAQVESIIDNQYGIYWDEIPGAQKFFSSAPFLVVMYANSSTYPDSTDGVGYPAELTLTPRGQYAKSVLFETQLSVGNIVPYDDYCNIFCNDSDAKNVTFDGTNIEGYSKVCLDDTFEVFNLPHIAPGTHSVTSDSGVAVILYGYGYAEAYAMSVPGTSVTLNSSDTIPPLVNTSTMCYGAFIHVTDSGLLPDTMPQSGLSEIQLDTVYNMVYLPDPNWIPGSGADTSGYSVNVVDLALPAIIIVEVYDLAGNETTVTSTYTPNYDSIKPPIQNLGVWINGQPNVAFDTIFNEGQTPFDLSVLHLTNDTAGFSIFDSIGGPVDLSPIPVGHYRIVEIVFEAKQKSPVIDSLVAGNACDSQTVAIIGSGGANDFLVTSQEWINEPLPAPSNGYVKTVEIENLSGIPITIDSASWPDAQFVAVPGQFPVVVQAAPAMVPFSISYIPDSNSSTISDRTQGSWYSHNVLESNNITPSPRFDSLIWIEPPPSAVNEANNSTSQATILPTNDGRSLEIILPADMNDQISFELVNVLGESVLRETFIAGTQTVDASSLPLGVYFYRLTSGQMSQSGKVILGQ
jgi:hypothetical protein